MLGITRKYPVFTALFAASVFGVLFFCLAGVTNLIPLDPAAPGSWVIFIWNGVHLGVALLVVGVLFQYSKEALRVGRGLLKKL